jgi:hypothetical protein
MKRFRTILALALLAFLCLGMLAGCGGNETANPQSTDTGSGNGGSGGTSASAGSSGSAGGTPAAEEAYVYTSEYIPLQGDLGGFASSLTYADGRFLTSVYGVIGDNTPEGVTPEFEGQYNVYGNIFSWINMDGSVERLENYAPIEMEEMEEDRTVTTFSLGFDATPDGKLWRTVA